MFIHKMYLMPKCDDTQNVIVCKKVSVHKKVKLAEIPAKNWTN